MIFLQINFDYISIFYFFFLPNINFFIHWLELIFQYFQCIVVLSIIEQDCIELKSELINMVINSQGFFIFIFLLFAGVERMWEAIMHGHFLTILNGNWVTLFDLASFTLTTKISCKDTWKTLLCGSRSSSKTTILSTLNLCSTQGD